MQTLVLIIKHLNIIKFSPIKTNHDWSWRYFNIVILIYRENQLDIEHILTYRVNMKKQGIDRIVFCRDCLTYVGHFIYKVANFT